MEYRLGARRYTAEDYSTLLEEAGFKDVVKHELLGDERLAKSIPSAAGLLLGRY